MELKGCQYIERVPVYAKSIAGIAIDPSEFEHPDGALIREKELPCRLVVDEGHTYCPRHELIMQHQAQTSSKELAAKS
jgi:hypothetical protein